MQQQSWRLRKNAETVLPCTDSISDDSADEDDEVIEQYGKDDNVRIYFDSDLRV